MHGKRKGLKYRFPGSTEMAGLDSEESISTLRPETTPRPPPHRFIKQNRSTIFEKETEESEIEAMGTVNRKPKGEARGTLALGTGSSEEERESEKENREPVLGVRRGRGRDDMDKLDVKRKWRSRFLFG